MSYDAQLDGGQNQEDWEDWLRWDPTIETTSPDDGLFNSGSSQSDSPLQDHAYLANTAPNREIAMTETLAPPLVIGEDNLFFEGGSGMNNEQSFFGPNGDVDFHHHSNLQRIPPNVPKLETNPATWIFPSTPAHEQDIITSALSTEHGYQLPSAISMAATTPSLHTSPESTSQHRTSLSYDSQSQPKKRGGRKRKAETKVETEMEEDMEGGAESLDGDEPPIKKTSHNVIEKRYRNNLNDKIVELRNSVPSLRAKGRANPGASEDLEGLTPAHKLNKATVMAKATEYIKHLEKRNKTMQDEMNSLQTRLAAVEASMGKSSERQASLSSSPRSQNVHSGEPSSSSQAGSPNLISLQQDRARLRHSSMPHHYTTQTAQSGGNASQSSSAEARKHNQHVHGRGSGIMNKFMLGTMAGVMVMEGFSEHQQSAQDGSSRGLSTIPINLFKRNSDAFMPSSGALTGQAALPLLKIMLVMGAMISVLAPVLTFSPRGRKKTRPAVQLPQAPSLASPVEVRRKAWLTAIQTVWVPKHFLVEVVAVCFNMIRLSVHRLIGSEAFTTITGTTKQEEAARIKAWDIAIDAQLAGGDAEVSYYRLLLTLMESGTLPDSPTRLMQKAVHFRVFFWEVANAGYGNMVGFKKFTENVGKIYWDSARKLQRELLHRHSQGRAMGEDEADLLPDHLARLVELDCEDVLSDEIIQRAWNLAWNKPNAYRTVANAERDSVVEDHAIRSPLDAVAAWYTNTTIDATLADAISDSTSTLDTEHFISLALSVAPPASKTHLRALATKAVLSNSNRESNIVAALEALPVVSPTKGMNLVYHAPASPDICTAMTIAKLLSLLSPSSSRRSQARAIEKLAYLQIAPAQFSLLSAIAACRLLRLLSSVRDLETIAEHSAEELAASLRVWVGTSAGRESGLGSEDRGKVVRLCVKVARQFGGWNGRDSGYVSVEHSPVRERSENVAT